MNTLLFLIPIALLLGCGWLDRVPVVAQGEAI